MITYYDRILYSVIYVIRFSRNRNSLYNRKLRSNKWIQPVTVHLIEHKLKFVL